MAQNKLVDWINEYIEEWREHRDTNYLQVWKEYERLWRGEWAAEDRLRDSERSRITSPALQQAIENHTAEIEEAIFGQGDHLFDIEDDMMDQDPRDIEYLKGYMKESFKKNKLRKAVGDVCLLASIYGTGIGEITIKKTKELVPATRPMPDVNARAIGVETKEKVNVVLKPISPQNFLIDPTATSIEDAMGVAIEEFVSAHKVAEAVKAGIYKDTEIEDDATPEADLEPSWIDEEYNDDKVKVLRYYGLVPSKLLDNQGEDDVEEIFKEKKESEQSELMEEYGDLVEAIVVIGNEQFLLKAERSPYMMKDRPVVAYQDDTVPNRFWGRGVAEKGYNMQKAIDAQLRSHLDSLALTTVPMMGMDATRLPRGSKFEIRPGKTIITNGNPAEIMMPFKFGQTSPENFATSKEFERMLLMATGTLDSQGVVSQASRDASGAGMSMAMAGIIKKYKRTLTNFQEDFMVPLIKKAAFRYMQFDPERYPSVDMKFIPTATLGIMAREYEQQQLIGLLQTLGPNTPVLPIILKGIIGNSSLSNRAELEQALTQMSQPDPQQAQMAQMTQQLQMEQAQATTQSLQARAQRDSAEAAKTVVETQLMPEELRAKVISSLSTNIDGKNQESEFEKRAKIAELMLKEADIKNKGKIVELQMQKQRTQ